MQQPCNSLSNAAFYEIALDLCSSKASGSIGSWDFHSEFIMAAFGMCIGSFAFHSQPTWITHKFDSLAMDQVFYVLHQANVRAMLPDSISDFTPYLPVLQLNGLCGDSGCFHEDARDAVRTFMDMFAAPVSEWDSKARAALPQSALLKSQLWVW
jgi:hypothetical protein